MARATSKSKDDEIEQLSEQIGQLKDDIAKLTLTMAEIGAQSKAEAEANIKSSVAYLRKRGAEGMEKAQAKAEDLGEQAAEAVRNQPAMAVGLAVGIGFLLGLITSRK